MDANDLSRREFLKLLWVGTAAAALGGLAVEGTQAACPAAEIKGAFTFFQKGSFLDMQFAKNPDLKHNPALSQTIDKLPLKALTPLRLKQWGLPYSGANSSNWLFVFDLGCNPPGSLTLSLTNQAGKMINVPLSLYKGTVYVAALRGVDAKTLAEFFAAGLKSEVTLAITGSGGATLWQSAALPVYRPRSGSRQSYDNQGTTSGGSSGGSSGDDGGGPGAGGGSWSNGSPG